MVRAPAHTLSRSNGFALLKPAEKPQLDPARILTLSGTIAINLLALGLLMMPLSMPPPAVSIDDKPGIEARQIPKPPEVVPVVPVQPQQPVRPRERAVEVQAPVEIAVAPVLVETGTEVAIDTPVIEDVGPVVESIASPSLGPAPMQLEYRSAPAPTYPRRALQQRLTGTVLLQVLVGTDGRPLEVKVAQSSGHRQLDEAAREQVLRRWSFQPATRNGLAVQAIGMVPIEFALKN